MAANAVVDAGDHDFFVICQSSRDAAGGKFRHSLSVAVRTPGRILMPLMIEAGMLQPGRWNIGGKHLGWILRLPRVAL
jgi:hypothetical protein